MLFRSPTCPPRVPARSWPAPATAVLSCVSSPGSGRTRAHRKGRGGQGRFCDGAPCLRHPSAPGKCGPDAAPKRPMAGGTHTLLPHPANRCGIYCRGKAWHQVLAPHPKAGRGEPCPHPLPGRPGSVRPGAQHHHRAERAVRTQPQPKGLLLPPQPSLHPLEAPLKPSAKGKQDLLDGVGTDGHQFICERCGKCKCGDCTAPRALPSCLACNGQCLCSAESALEHGTCMCLVKGIFYQDRKSVV